MRLIFISTTVEDSFETRKLNILREFNYITITIVEMTQASQMLYKVAKSLSVLMTILRLRKESRVKKESLTLTVISSFTCVKLSQDIDTQSTKT